MYASSTLFHNGFVHHGNGFFVIVWHTINNTLRWPANITVLHGRFHHENTVKTTWSSFLNIHWIKITTTWTNIHIQPTDPPTRLHTHSYNHIVSIYVVWIYRFWWLWFCGPFSVFRIIFCNATHPSCIYSSIYSKSSFPHPPHLISSHLTSSMCLLLLMLLSVVVVVVICTCSGTQNSWFKSTSTLLYYTTTNDIRSPSNENVTGK